MIKYAITALASVLATAMSVGLPMYARFVAMETTITTLAVSVDHLTTQVQALKIEVTELQVTNNLLNYEVKERLRGPQEH